MIKPINISPLNTSKTLEYECSNCGDKGTFYLTNTNINIDHRGNILEDLIGYNCPKCGKSLSEEDNNIYD